MKLHLTDLLEKLVSFVSVTHDQEANRAALTWVKSQLPPSLHVMWREINGYPALWATTRQNRNPKVVLAAHIDVVPGSEQMFAPRLEGTKLYGRGTFDMKFAIACYLKLFQELSAADLAKLDIGMLLTTDEEIGGKNGVLAFLEEGFQPGFVLLPDGGNNFILEEKGKGMMQCKILATGKSAHGSRTWEGINPFDQLLPALLEIQKLFVSEPCSDPKHYHNTLTIARVQGGTSQNSIPESAVANLDIRYVPEESYDHLWEKISTIVATYANLELVEVAHGTPFSADLKHNRIQDWIRLAQEKFGIPLQTLVSHGTSDARHFADYRIPVLLTRPKGGGHHGESEWIDVDSLEQFYQILKDWVQLA